MASVTRVHAQPHKLPLTGIERAVPAELASTGEPIATSMRHPASSSSQQSSSIQSDVAVAAVGARGRRAGEPNACRQLMSLTPSARPHTETPAPAETASICPLGESAPRRRWPIPPEQAKTDTGGSNLCHSRWSSASAATLATSTCRRPSSRIASPTAGRAADAARVPSRKTYSTKTLL
eukprot:scaffold45373_cov208-Isochrysis_galbana.AAC.3